MALLCQRQQMQMQMQMVPPTPRRLHARFTTA